MGFIFLSFNIELQCVCKAFVWNWRFFKERVATETLLSRFALHLVWQTAAASALANRQVENFFLTFFMASSCCYRFENEASHYSSLAFSTFYAIMVKKNIRCMASRREHIAFPELFRSFSFLLSAQTGFFQLIRNMYSPATLSSCSTAATSLFLIFDRLLLSAPTSLNKAATKGIRLIFRTYDTRSLVCLI